MKAIIKYHLAAWVRLQRVHKFETTYGHFYAYKGCKRHLQFYANTASYELSPLLVANHSFTIQ